MSGLIKAGAINALNDFVVLDRTTQMKAQLEGYDSRISELEREIAERDAIIAELGGARREGYDEGFSAGREAGRMDADSGVADRLSALADGIKDARSAFDKQLMLMEKLAALLARSSLDRMFANNSHRASLVTAIIERQVHDLDADAIIDIEVSREDFPDDLALENISRHMRGLHIKAKEELETGACRINLNMGRIDAGLSQQWEVVGSILDDLADGRIPS